MFDAAADVGVAAFMAGDSAPSDEVVVADLERAGVEPWLARRLNVFLPLAFGRRLLGGVALSDAFVDEHGSHRLDDDPVYPAIAARAVRADQAEIERIGLRSSELNAVNQALNAGFSLDGMGLAPMALSRTLPPPADGDGGVPSAVAAFEELLGANGFPVVDGKVGRLEVGAGVDARPRPAPDIVMAQAAFAVRHPDVATGSLLVSFAGAAPTWRDAINQGVAKLEQSVLHPIIAGLLDRDAGSGHVSWQTWDHPGGTFDVCLGRQLAMTDAAVEIPRLTGVLEKLRTMLAEVPLTRQIHTLRVIASYNEGRLISHGTLLDGDLWRPGEAATSGSPLPGTSTPLELQQYALLLPA